MLSLRLDIGGVVIEGEYRGEEIRGGEILVATVDP